MELLEKIGPLGLCRKDLLSVHDVNGESAIRRAALYLRVSALEQMTEKGICRTAREIAVGVATVQRIKAAMAA